MRRSLLGLLWFCLLAGSSGKARGAAPCTKLFQKGMYIKAADCFLSAEGRVKAGAPKLVRAYRGRYLRNAVTSLLRAAKASYSPAAAAWLRERALKVLRRYIAQKLFETPAEHKRAQLRAPRIARSIGYAQVLLDVHHPKALSCLRGYRWKQCQRGNSWRLKLRPGGYQLTIQYSPQMIVRKRLYIHPHRSHGFDFYPPGQAPAPQTARGLLRFTSRPSGARIYLNDIAIGRTPLQAKLPAGSYRVTLRKACFQTQSWQKQLHPHKAAHWHAKLRAHPRPHGGRRWWGGWSAGIGAALMVVGVVSQLVAHHYHGEALSYRGDPASFFAHRPAYRSAAQAGNVWRTAGYLQLGLGAALVTTGALLSLLPSPKPHQCRAPPRQ